MTQAEPGPGPCGATRSLRPCGTCRRDISGRAHTHLIGFLDIEACLGLERSPSPQIATPCATAVRRGSPKEGALGNPSRQLRSKLMSGQVICHPRKVSEGTRWSASAQLGLLVRVRMCSPYRPPSRPPDRLACAPDRPPDRTTERPTYRPLGIEAFVKVLEGLGSPWMQLGSSWEELGSRGSLDAIGISSDALEGS